MSKSTKQKSFVKKDKIKFTIELKKGSDGTFGIDFNKNMKLKIIPGKSLPKGLEKDDKLISIDGISIINKEAYDRVKRTNLAWSTEADFVFTRFRKQRYALKKRSLSKIDEVSSSKEKSSSLSNNSKSKSKSKFSSSDEDCVGFFCKYPSRKGRKKTKKRKKK